MWGFMFGALSVGVAFPCIGFGAPMPRRRPLTSVYISYPLREDDTASGNFICFLPSSLINLLNLLNLIIQLM